MLLSKAIIFVGSTSKMKKDDEVIDGKKTGKMGYERKIALATE